MSGKRVCRALFAIRSTQTRRLIQWECIRISLAFGQLTRFGINSNVELATYVRLCEAFGVDYSIILVHCSVETAIARNVHNVPVPTIMAMYGNLLRDANAMGWRQECVDGNGVRPVSFDWMPPQRRDDIYESDKAKG